MTKTLTKAINVSKYNQYLCFKNLATWKGELRLLESLVQWSKRIGLQPGAARSESWLLVLVSDLACLSPSFLLCKTGAINTFLMVLLRRLKLVSFIETLGTGPETYKCSVNRDWHRVWKGHREGQKLHTSLTSDQVQAAWLRTDGSSVIQIKWKKYLSWRFFGQI